MSTKEAKDAATTSPATLVGPGRAADESGADPTPAAPDSLDWEGLGFGWCEEPGWQLLDDDDDPAWELDAWCEEGGPDAERDRWTVAFWSLYSDDPVDYLTGPDGCTEADAYEVCAALVLLHAGVLQGGDK